MKKKWKPNFLAFLVVILIFSHTFVNYWFYYMGYSFENTFGTRLKLARKMAGMSQQNLADALDQRITKQALSKYELGEMMPTGEMLLAVSKALKQKPDFFVKQKTLELGRVDFRKRTKLSLKQEESIIERVRDFVERYLELEEILQVKNPFENPLKNFKITQKNELNKAAQALRESWNLGDDPIPNISEMLEMRGIKVVIIEADEAFDGLATTTESGIPIIVVNKNGISIERLRFTIVHELAHTLLNLEILGDNEKLIEEWCHYFSSCFIIPDNMVYKLLGSKIRNYLYINELEKIKSYFGISIRALVHRFKTMGIITPTYYIKWNVYLSKTYGGIKEPGEYKGEENALGFEMLISRGLAEGIISISKAAALCNTDINQLRKKYVSIA